MSVTAIVGVTEHTLKASATVGVSQNTTEVTLNMPFTISLGSAKTFNLFQEAKLKSGQMSDEEFVQQLLAEHHGLCSRPIGSKDIAPQTSIWTQVDVLDLVRNDNALPCSIKDNLMPVNDTDKQNLEEVCGTEGNSTLDVISGSTTDNTSCVTTYSDMSVVIDTSKSDNNTTTEEHAVQFTYNPGEDNGEKSSFETPDDELQGVSVIMFGCKECCMYFSKYDKVLSHIQNVHSGLIKDNNTCKDFVMQESTVLGVKKKCHTVRPKVEFGMISEEEVTEAIQNQQEEINEERKRKLSEKKTMKSKKLKEVLRCSECNEVFGRERSLRDHIKLCHSIERSKLPKCNICNKTFLYESIVKRHIALRHSQKNPTTKVTKHPKGFLCETCGSTFTQKHTLKLHMNKHLDIKPYVCNHCGKKFTWLNALEYHERTHTGERPYSCHLCSQRFKTPSDLKRHQVVHTKEKPFACTMCPKKFSQGTTLRKHVGRIHRTPDCVNTNEQSTIDQIISLIPILQHEEVQVTIHDDTIEFVHADASCIATLQT